MIVLGKDKIDERYNISDNGIITDLQGNIQKTSISNNRPSFKSQLIHRIQMWTKYGWRDPKLWDIHHKDENKLNNSIDNLVYLTRAEHRRIHTQSIERRINLSKALKGHRPWGPVKQSLETRKKISFANKGKTYSRIYGPLTEEQREIRRQNSIGKIWINNGIINKFVYPNNIPEGFVKGMKKRCQK